MAAAPRIVSLLPSCTEIVCALGLEQQLVGRSHECDFPPAIRHLPECTGSNLDTQGSSAGIDREVKSLLRQALSIYSIDIDRLKELRPDVILTQSQCEVCAVSLPEVEHAVSVWTGRKPRILSLAPNSLADVWEDILRVSGALGVPERGAELVPKLKNRAEQIARLTRDLPCRPSVACIEWLDPLMAAGNWVPELVELAGGLNLFGEAGKHSPWLNWEAVREHDPEVVVILPCGFDVSRTWREMPALANRPGWEGLRAVRTGRVFIADGSQYFNRPGPRLVESLEILAELIHPRVFHFGHGQSRWKKWGHSVA
ncbi:MAG TPA: cobalamin-binding protein [Verrucomicrobiae bacterium]|nr:cobalamin-binding protein [Verrucomicrobiae bacterium]